ncbi:uncharacterized protein N7496_012631 [Penicillium cataractarum]|uniref:Uncharacterized protein n=1 Tax=Penicillium cataractarum TaxID=2100454 RepID=A0A9W9USY4_9EURO|nr:uncharacterized protein N7496_012631 [Penicillium cataractarum]KAJ5355419.1 hypothetical protein N7496_012631 [Penicillium cataractarum]
MASSSDKLCPACLKIFESGKANAVISSQEGDPASGLEQTGTQEQSGEDSDWRRAPVHEAITSSREKKPERCELRKRVPYAADCDHYPDREWCLESTALTTT